MTDFPEVIPEDAICDACKKPIGMHPAACAQAVEDDEGNEIVDAPFVWFHKSCLGVEK